MSPPRPLPENAALAWAGEPAWAPARLDGRDARALLRAPNRCGRPNADVLRRRLAVVDGEPVEGWQIDFPEHFTPQEAMLYEQPWARLGGRGGEWQNPGRNPDLRRALARVSRFLALPAEAASPDWRWIEDEVLPDASLVVLTRDDDFTHGVVTSPTFAHWVAAWRDRLDWPGLVAAFPFPWPPGTPLSALTAAQEERRHAVARAARNGDIDALDRAVAAAYEWPDAAGAQVVTRLFDLNAQRSG